MNYFYAVQSNFHPMIAIYKKPVLLPIGYGVMIALVFEMGIDDSQNDIIRLRFYSIHLYEVKEV
jgi:hypothetical protein